MDPGDKAALAILRAAAKKFRAGYLEGAELIGYFCLLHVAWRLDKSHALYPPPGCWWRHAFWTE